MEIPINEDIRKFKTRDIGNFSFKEAIFIGLGFAASLACYQLQKNYFGMEEVSYELAMLPAIPFIAFGFFKPFGLTFRQFMQYVFVEKYLIPPVLKWQNDYEVDLSEIGELFGEEYAYSEDRIMAACNIKNTNKEKRNKNEKKDK